MERKRLLVAYGVVTLLAAVVITLLIVAFGHRPGQVSTQVTDVRLSGTLSCLPHQNSAPGRPQTLECAVGLKTEDGRFYKLLDLSATDSSTSFNTRVYITGQMSQPSADETYDVVGVIKVTYFKTSTGQ